MATGTLTEAQVLNSEVGNFAEILLAANEAETEHAEDEAHEDAEHGEAEAHGDDAQAEGHTEAGHEGATGMPQLDVTSYSNQIFWLILCLIAVYFLFSKIALPRIGETIEQRGQAIRRDLDRAAEMKLKAEEAEEQYNQALADARSRAHEIAEKNKAEIQAKMDAETAKADAEITKQTEASMKRIAKVQKEADASVKDVATDVTKAILEALSPSVADDKAISSAVSKALKG